MIFIVISIKVRPDKRDDFLHGMTQYCAQVRQEPGNLHFTCYESVDAELEYIVMANYADGAAGEAHVASTHAKWFFGWLPSVVSEIPKIVYQELPAGTGWVEMGEVAVHMRGGTD